MEKERSEKEKKCGRQQKKKACHGGASSVTSPIHFNPSSTRCRLAGFARLGQSGAVYLVQPYGIGKWIPSAHPHILLCRKHGNK